MRIWGRLPPDPVTGKRKWVVVESDKDTGDFSYGRVTELAQTLLLNLNECPMAGDYGIPAQDSIISQSYPDYYVRLTESRFAQYFTSLVITRRLDGDDGAPATSSSGRPVYLVDIVLLDGTPVRFESIPY